MFISGVTQDAVTGLPLQDRARAAMLPPYVPVPRGMFAAPESRWVSRAVWEAFPRRTEWAGLALEAIAVADPDGPVIVMHAAEGVMVTESDRRFALQDLEWLISVSGASSRVEALRQALRDVTRNGAERTVDTGSGLFAFSLRDERTGVLRSLSGDSGTTVAIPAHRFEAWLRALPASDPADLHLEIQTPDFRGPGRHRVSVTCLAVERFPVALSAMQRCIEAQWRLSGFGSERSPCVLGGRVDGEEHFEAWITGTIDGWRALAANQISIAPLRQMASVLGGTVSIGIDSAGIDTITDLYARSGSLPFAVEGGGMVRQVIPTVGDGTAPSAEALTVLAEQLEAIFRSGSDFHPSTWARVENGGVVLGRAVDFELVLEQTFVWSQVCFQNLVSVRLDSSNMPK